ncbi:MAG: 4Fe-4S binding protein [Candidatus Omnitrophica bacterium]|nr:4Fe-4S binding protein [Candidatus Omnitrophota bacterium]MCM8806363.1 4Fe-4S binding protein [Candidatus Omnitrophota bacterium]
MFKEIPREKIPWFPKIDYEKCIGCKECYNFCKNGVYQWNEEKNIPIVKNPYNCVVGCSACANICNGNAIDFPTKKELMEAIAKLKENK